MDGDDLAPGSLLERGLAILADLLGPAWAVTARLERERGPGTDATVEVRPRGDDVSAQLLVRLQKTVTPRIVEEALAHEAELLRQLAPDTNLMIITPWVSQKTQRLLQEHGIAYLDLTGNVFLQVARPAIVIRTVGASRAPRAMSAKASRTTLAGPKAGRLVRLLADVRPPYRATELAAASGLSLPYVSRLLDTLGDQLLIRRDGRIITDVDWPNLLRARAAESSLLRQNSHIGMIAQNGTISSLSRISTLPADQFSRIAVTGSYAARDVAPLSVGGQLMFYVAPELDIDDLADRLGLLPVREKADVLLLQPPDPVVFERAKTNPAYRSVALSQLVLDCLSGPGRMPAEGEAVIDYMLQEPNEWRISGMYRLASQGLF